MTTTTSLLPLAAALFVATPPPHPGHSSYAEISCNAKQQQLQISLGMLAIDFEKALSQRAGTRVNLDKTKGVEKLVESYLSERFVVTMADGTKPQPQFVGREDAGKNVWIYFTIPLALTKGKDSPKREGAKKEGTMLAGIQLCDRVLMELNREQRNLVEIREGTWRRYLTYTEKAQQHLLRPPVKPKKSGA